MLNRLDPFVAEFNDPRVRRLLDGVARLRHTHAQPLPDAYCSGCRVSILEPFDIARHNRECAETGERSYQGHTSYKTAAQRFGALKAEQDANVKARLARNGLVDWR